MTPTDLELARKNLEIAKQALAAANQQALAANAQVELARWQLGITIVLTLIPVAVALWQLFRSEKLRFSSGYYLRGGGEESFITIHNNNQRAVHVSFWEVYWAVPKSFIGWRKEKVEDAWQDDYIASFDITEFGRQSIYLGTEEEFKWPHPHKRARLCVQLSIGGEQRPKTLLVKDQAKKDRDA